MTTTQAFRRVFGDNFFYVLYFQEPGPADAELHRDPATTLRTLMAPPTTRRRSQRCGCCAGPEGFIAACPSRADSRRGSSRDEFDHYVTEFTRQRLHRAAELVSMLRSQLGADRANPPASTITAPALFIGGAADPTLAYTPRDRVRDVVAGDYREVMIDGGHWLLEERPNEVNDALLDFLDELELQ